MSLPGALRPLEDPPEAAAEQEAELLGEEDPGNLGEGALGLAAQIQQRGPQESDAEAETEENAPIGKGGLEVSPEPSRHPFVPPHPGRWRGAVTEMRLPPWCRSRCRSRSRFLLPTMWLRSPPSRAGRWLRLRDRGPPPPPPGAGTGAEPPLHPSIHPSPSPSFHPPPQNRPGGPLLRFEVKPQRIPKGAPGLSPPSPSYPRGVCIILPKVGRPPLPHG